MIITIAQARCIWALARRQRHGETWATVSACLARGLLDSPSRLSYRGRQLAVHIDTDTMPRTAYAWDGQRAHAHGEAPQGWMT